jgi:4-amino-4-deoxy-L-arabinose transferase-like glycosyltransferase
MRQPPLIDDEPPLTYRGFFGTAIGNAILSLRRFSTLNRIGTTSTANDNPSACANSGLANDLWVLVALAMFCLAPFLGKPFHIDDPLFVWAAQQIHKNPADFYGFSLNWYGFSYPMWATMKNPPLASYYIALVALVTGFRETALHAAFLIPNFALLTGIYFLARRFCRYPLLAVAVAFLTPAALVSATSVMCDTMMLAFWCWAVVLWLSGMETGRAWLLMIAGLLIALAALTKYFAISLIPLLAVYALVNRRWHGWWMVALVLPAAILFGYDRYTAYLYNRSALLDASLYANYHHHFFGMESPYLQAVLAGVFLGGCLLTTLAYAPLAWSWWQSTIAVALAVGLAIALFGAKELLGYVLNEKDGSTVYMPLHVALFLLAAVHVLAILALELWNLRDPRALLLLLWAAGTLAFAGFFNWVVNARTLLPLAPVVGIVVARRIERRHGEWIAQDPLRLLWFGAAPLLISLAAAWADHRYAQAAYSAANTLAERYGPLSDPLWFEGHWGFQYYMQRHGAVPLDIGDTLLTQGNYVVIPGNNTNIFYPQNTLAQVDAINYKSWSWPTLLYGARGINFYAGTNTVPLPLAFAPVPNEGYYVFRAIRTTRIKEDFTPDDPGKVLER